MLIKVKFKSSALDKVAYFNVLLPNNYIFSNSYQVLFILHGMGRNCDTVTNDCDLVSKLETLNYICVFPNGEDGCYINSTVIKDSNYEDYLSEVLELIRNMYNIKNENNFILGWSMGALGAANFIIKNTDFFQTFISIIGLLDYPNNTYKSEDNYPIPSVFDLNSICSLKYSAVNNVEKFRNLNIMIYAGKKAFDYLMNQRFKEVLKNNGIKYTYYEEDVSHEWKAVRSGIFKAIEWINRINIEKMFVNRKGGEDVDNGL